jgi:hypothetical protein
MEKIATFCKVKLDFVKKFKPVKSKELCKFLNIVESVTAGQHNTWALAVDLDSVDTLSR